MSLCFVLGNNNLVPVLIPKDCFKGLALLTDKETRKMVGINQKNEYVFPSTKDSKYHVSGSVIWLFFLLMISYVASSNAYILHMFSVGIKIISKLRKNH